VVQSIHENSQKILNSHDSSKSLILYTLCLLLTLGHSASWVFFTSLNSVKTIYRVRQ